MERYTAERIMQGIDGADKALNYLANCICAIEDKVEGKRMLMLIGGMLADLYIEIAPTVLKDHPDLDPDPRKGVRETPEPS